MRLAPRNCMSNKATATVPKTPVAAPSAPVAVASLPAENTSVSDLAARLKKSSSATPAAAPEPAREPATASSDPDVDPTADPMESDPADDPAPEGDEAPAEDAEPAAEPAPEGAPAAVPPETLATLQALVAEAGGDPGLLNQKIVKRFDALTALRYDAETRAEKAEQAAAEASARLEEATKAGPPTALNPAPFHPEIAQLDTQLADANGVLNWADDAMDAAKEAG